MTTPTPEALRHRAAARRWARFGLIEFTAASVVVNVAVITAAGGDLLRLLIGALAPIVLGQMTHQLTKQLQAELTVSGIAAVVHWALASATGAIGAGAFYLSFETLRRAAEPDHGQSAWVFPATLDLAIVVCSVGLAVIARADEADQRAGVPTRVTVWNRFTARFSDRLPGRDLVRTSAPVARGVDAEQPVHGPVHELVYPAGLTWLGSADHLAEPVEHPEPATTRPVDVPALREADPAPTATQTTSVRDSEPEQPSALRDADIEEIPVTSVDSRDAISALRDAKAPSRRLTAVPASRSDSHVPASRRIETVPVRDAEPAPDATQTAAMRDVDRDASDGDEYLRRAELLVEAGRTTASVTAVHAVLRGKAAGESNRDVAAETGLTESAVQRITKAARELEADTETPEPALA